MTLFLTMAALIVVAEPNEIAGRQAVSPDGRSCHAMAWSPRDSGVVVVGGGRVCGRDVLNDSATWIWRGSAWNRIGAAFPGSREDVMLAFDTRRNVLVLHGGRNVPTVFGDTWESDGVRWRQVSTTGPGLLEHPAATFDARRGRLVLFGGAVRGSGFSRRTWEWDGARWAMRDSTGPAARIGHSMTATSGGVFLYGGFNESGQLRDLWTWDGERWTRLDTAGPAESEGPALVAIGDTIALLAPDGAGADRRYRAWRWVPNGWQSWGDRGPPARIGQGMVWDPVRRRVVLFGGAAEGASTSHDDVWEFDGSWRRAR